METPLVTVGVPTRNRPAGLRRTLGSLVGQTYRRLEIIVSDNASSTPETAAIVREFQQSDPRVVYHRQPEDIGLDANFRFLLGQARGEYFFWAADDDEHSPDFVEVCLAHVGGAGSAMTGMRNAVRPRGLLRWKPPVALSPDRGPFDNAIAFLSNPQASLIYGLHRTETARAYLHEIMYSYYDYFFILRQILSHGFVIAPKVCFHVGIDTEEPALKPQRPRPNAVYEYWPFVRDSASTTLRGRTLAPLQKLRLLYLVIYVAMNEFAHFERDARPLRAKAATTLRLLLGRLASLMRVPLPPHPAAMVLPEDPAELCTMFVAAKDLISEESLRRHIEQARQQLAEKRQVIWSLRRQLAENCRRPAGRLAALAQRLFLGQVGSDSRLAADQRPHESPPAANEPVDALRHRLGLLLRGLEESEGEIQRLLARVRQQQRWTAALYLRASPGGARGAGPRGDRR